MRLVPGCQNKEDVRTYFGSLSEGYDQSRISDWQRFFQQKLVDSVEPGDSLAVLDVGCGTGWAVRTLARRYPSADIYGIDISESMVEVARKKSRSLSNALFRAEDAEQLGFEDEKFDYVITSHAFRHCPDPDKALSEFYRVLKQDGTLLLLDFCRDIQRPLLRFVAATREIFPSGNTRGYYSSTEMVSQMQRNGFSNVHATFRLERLFFLRKLITSEIMLQAHKQTTEEPSLHSSNGGRRW